MGLPPLEELEEILKKKINDLAENKKKTILNKYQESLNYAKKRLEELSKDFAKRISI